MVNTVFSMCSVFTVELLPRKLLLGVCFSAMAASQLLFQFTSFRTAAVVLLLMGFQLGPGSLFFLLCSELFDDGCTALAFTVNYLSNSAVVFLYPLTRWAWLLFFAVMATAGATLLANVPETRGKSVEVIQREILGADRQGAAAAAQTGEKLA